MRFPEFSGEWEEKKLGEVIIEGKLGGNYENSELNNGIPVIKMGNVGRGGIIIDKIQYLPQDEKYNEDDILKEGDLLFNTRNTLELVGKVALWRSDLPCALYNSNLMRIKVNDLLEPSNRFLNLYFNTKKSINQLRSFATGTTSVAAIYSRDLANFKIVFPSVREQRIIADFLSVLDSKIKTQRKTIEELNAFKKGIAKKIFSQQLRFKDDNGNDFPKWESSKIEEVCEKQSSNISANKIEDNFGEFPIYGATGFLKNVDFYEVKADYIAIIKDGAGIGRLFLCNGKSSVLGTLDIITPKNINLYFLYCLLSNINFDKYSTGSTIPHIYFKDYKSEFCMIPCVEEQSKIANCLSSIDSKIDIENQILQKLEEQKKYFLANLFI